MDKEKQALIDEIAEKCESGEGYLLFAAVLTPKKDARGNRIIEHHYRRFHFSFEDCKGAKEHMKKFIDEELQSLLSNEDSNGQNLNLD
jgi:hypothetical protein